MDNIIFISVFNYGCIEIAENHIISLKHSGITNYMAYVTDNKSYVVLSEKGYNVTYYHIDTSIEKFDFGKNQFNELSYLRYKIIGELLNEGKIVWYLDVDTVVLYDINKLVSNYLHRDIVMQNDINMPCTGCMLIFPNPKTKQIIEIIYNLKTSKENDQIIFLRFLQINSSKINLDLLDIEHFPNGLLYFNELSDNPRFRELQIGFNQSKKMTYFVHANWMVGIDTKIAALKRKKLWYL